jgi:hypothetical protein
MVAHACNPSYSEGGDGGSQSELALAKIGKTI